MSQDQHRQEIQLEEEENQVCPFSACAFSLLTNGSCLAHVINLAMQMLISTYSKSPHFDLTQPDAHVPTSRIEVGLVRAIVVKVQLCI